MRRPGRGIPGTLELETEQVEGRSGVPGVLDHKARKSLPPWRPERCFGTVAGGTMPLQRPDHVAPGEPERPIALAKMSFILSDVAHSFSHQIAGAPSYQDFRDSSSSGMERFEVLLI